MINAILFDFDGTLVDFITSDIYSLNCLHSHLGLAVCFDDFLETAVSEIMKFHQLVEAEEVDPLLMHQFRLEHTLNQYNISWNDDYLAFYRNKLFASCQPFAGVTNLLSMLKQKTKVGLITNAYDPMEQQERIKRAGLSVYFDVIVIAGELNIYKPDPAIFTHTLNLIETAPNESVYIGDSIQHDILGAKSVGMKTILLSKQISRGKGIADHVVPNIGELSALLEHLLV